MDFIDTKQTRDRLLALSQLEERLSFRISRLSKLVDNDASRYLAGSSLNLTSYRILMVLSIFRETSAADLARLMVIDRAQVSRSVAEMMKQGFLADRGDPTNKRRKLLQLTEKGQAALDRAQPHFAQRQKQFQDLLSAEEFSGLTSAIDKLSRLLAQLLEHPEALPSAEQAGKQAHAQDGEHFGEHRVEHGGN
ncbi:MarR family winged helix-turn-helix transcriptional regulator [Oceanibium sediminis]|uniref:MarR family winged helix-turn-helix transcriptional regulator n=1 Tax=Oceanibium sediminis TaxID=2026339 RepID=UPI000DD30E72|nr:MarR family transcriptional regulator [Oceanibium sediminis]